MRNNDDNPPDDSANDPESVRRAAYSAKLRRIRRLAAQVSEPGKHRYDLKSVLLRDCWFGYSRNAVTRERGRHGKAGRITFRCAVPMHRCPSCLSSWRILRARRADYAAIVEAVKPLREGERLDCFVLSGTATKPVTLYRLENLMRAVGISGSDWGAELACLPKTAAFQPVVVCTGENAAVLPDAADAHARLKPSKPCGVNALVVARPGFKPDFSQLGPAIRVEFPPTLPRAWELYLQAVAATIESAPDAVVVDWMFASRHRSFHGVRMLQGAKCKNDKRIRGEMAAKGIVSPVTVSIFDEREKHERVEQRTETRAKELFPTLKPHHIERFLAEARPIIKDATDKPDDYSVDEHLQDMTPEQRAAYDAEQAEMRAQLAEVEEEVRRLKRIIGEEDNRESRLPSPSKWTQ